MVRKKTCQHCFKHKGLEAFVTDVDSRDGRSTWCKHCIDHYRKIPKIDTSPEKAVQRRIYREKCNHIKSNMGCAICKEKRHICLEFHHKHPEDKVDTISNLIRYGKEWDEIQAEIDKCEVLCANCHRCQHQQILEEFELNA